MVVTTTNGVYVAYDATSDVEIVLTTSGIDAAWQEAAVVVGVAVPIMSSNGIHSIIFGGQIITGG